MRTMQRSTLIAAAVVAAFAGGARAQAPRFEIELRGGPALPTQQLGARDLETASTVEMTLAYRPVPAVAVYGGWDWFHSAMDRKLGEFADAEATGYAFGVRLDGPALGKATPWLRAGGVYNHIELEGDVTDAYASSGHTLGWEAGAGAAVPVSGRFTLTPGVRYRSFAPDISQLGGDHRLSYVTVEIGISARL